MDVDLLCCPFCGNAPTTTISCAPETEGLVSVGCSQDATICPVAPNVFAATRTGAIAAWIRRALEPVAWRLLEAWPNLAVTDEELLRIRNECEGNDGQVKIWAKMLQMLVDHVRATRSHVRSVDYGVADKSIASDVRSPGADDVVGLLTARSHIRNVVSGHHFNSVTEFLDRAQNAVTQEFYDDIVGFVVEHWDGMKAAMGVIRGEEAMRNAATPSTPVATNMPVGEGWVPNKDYDNEATWPPRGHPLGGLFHDARLQWPANMDSRASYERVVDWLTLPQPSPVGRDAVEGEAKRPSAIISEIQNLRAQSSVRDGLPVRLEKARKLLRTQAGQLIVREIPDPDWMPAATAVEEAIHALASPLQSSRDEVTPDYCYDPKNWEVTFEWSDRDMLVDGMPVGDVMEIATLHDGAPRWAAHVVKTWHEGEPDETEVEFFGTKEEAATAIAALKAPRS